MLPSLSDAERTLYNTRLTEARAARHLIVMGKAVKKTIDQNGESVEYSVANISKLDDYITSLENLLNPCVAAYRRPRAIGFLF